MSVTGRLRPYGELGKELAREPSATVDAILGARTHVDVLVPRTQIAGRMRLVSRAEALAIVAETRAHFAAKGIPVDASSLAYPGMMSEWNNEIAVRHLAVAVRDPADISKPLAALAEWQECDDDQISALWQEWQDLRERLDPLHNLDALSEQEFAAITAAAKKKDSDSLMSFGSRKLASFAISSAAPPAS